MKSQYALCPLFHACVKDMVSTFLRKIYQRIEPVEGIERIKNAKDSCFQWIAVSH
jgi:hypothetical protein